MFWRAVSVLALIGGAGAFAAGVAHHPLEAWSMYLINFLFWSGLCAAGVVFAALLELTRAEWALPIRPLAERFARFLPISIALYLPLLSGARVLFPWVEHTPATHRAWYTIDAFGVRDCAALLIFSGASAWFVTRSHRERTRTVRRRVTTAAVCVLIVYAMSFSLLTIDLVMSLRPGWTSTLFPAYVFTGNLYGAIAALGIVAGAHSRGLAEPLLDEVRARDLGKLLLAFALIWLYLFWSQFLAIWYGNLPREFEFPLTRIRGAWWAAAWAVLGLCFALPLTVLLARSGRRPLPVTVVSIICLSGLWLERLLMIAGGHQLNPAAVWIGGGVTFAFAALFVLSQAGPAARHAPQAGAADASLKGVRASTSLPAR